MLSMNNKLILMKGIPCSGKTTYIEEMKQDKNTIVLSSDGLRETLGLDRKDNSVFGMIDKMLHDYLNQGKDIIIDATNLTHKKHTHYRKIARKHRAEYVCCYVFSNPKIWEEYAKQRIEEKWTDYDMETMFKIRRNMFAGLCFPLKNEFDEIRYRFLDETINPNSKNFFKHYYKKHLDLFLNNPKEFFKPLKSCGYLYDVFPELDKAYGFDLKSKSSNLTLDEHIFKLCENIEEKKEVNIWSAILHDLGKVVDGIQQTDEQGNCFYMGHQGASTEIAFLVLNRFDFSIEMIEEVCTIVNKHHYVSYTKNMKQKSKAFLGHDLFDKITKFQEADKKSKNSEDVVNEVKM